MIEQPANADKNHQFSLLWLSKDDSSHESAHQKVYRIDSQAFQDLELSHIIAEIALVPHYQKEIEKDNTNIKKREKKKFRIGIIWGFIISVIAGLLVWGITIILSKNPVPTPGKEPIQNSSQNEIPSNTE